MARKLLALLVGVTLLLLGLVFSLVVLSVVAVFGLAAWGYVSWKARGNRRAMPETASKDSMGEVIEGEVIVVDEREVSSISVLSVTTSGQLPPDGHPQTKVST